MLRSAADFVSDLSLAKLYYVWQAIKNDELSIS